MRCPKCKEKDPELHTELYKAGNELYCAFCGYREKIKEVK